MLRSIHLATRKAIVPALVVAVACAALPIEARERVRTVTPQLLNEQIVAGYQVASGDKLRVTVFDEPSLSGEYQISVEGDLSLPLLESIPAQGLTTTRLGETIAQQLQAGGYVLVPRVSVEVAAHRPFYILGEVNKPGEYPFSGDLTLSQAVAKAGGFTARANKRVIFLERQQGGEKVRVKLGDLPLKVAPGDTITIREAFF